MQIDQNMLKRLLAMDDRQLGQIIGKIASESGIDPSLINLDPNSIGSIREALGSATDSDLEQLNAIYESYRQNRRS